MVSAAFATTNLQVIRMDHQLLTQLVVVDMQPRVALR